MSTEILCHPYDWKIVEDRNDLSKNIQILAWCLDKDSNPVLLRFESFPVHCMLELPINRDIPWKARIPVFKEWLEENCRDFGPVHIQYEEHEKIYYYRPEKRPMYRLFFRNTIAMNRFKYFIEKPHRIPGIGYTGLDVWETKISPIRKLLTYRNCRYSQWMSIQGISPEDPISRVEREYVVDFMSMRSLTPEESKGLVTYPGVMAFDIECYAKNHNAMPSPLNASDDAYMNSVIYWRVGRPETRKRYLIVVGECNPIEGVEIIHVNHELEVQSAMRDLVLRHDPDVITGYNVLSFDYWYLDQRLKRRGREWGNMGRLLVGKTEVESLSWESSAFSHNDFHILQMDGRITIDLLPNVRRDFKLDTYNLNTVAKKFLGRTKHDVDAKTMFVIYERLREAMRGEDDVERRHWIEEMTRVARYCVQDSELVVDLFEKLNIWIALVEMSNIVGITIMDIFTRGQQVRCVSQIYDLAYRLGFVLDSRNENEEIKFEGGKVQDPIPGLHDNIICVDFSSLYPSLIQAYNIDYTTLVPKEDNDKIPDEMCTVFNLDIDELEDKDNDDEDEDGTKNFSPSGGRKHCFKFVKREHRNGILPQLVANLVAERKAVRKQLATEPDPVMQIILDKRQLALKQSANSMYGFLGVRKGKLPLMEAAICVTFKGRESIGVVNKYLIDTYNATVVYGDSVTGDTPVLIRYTRDGRQWIDYKMIQDVVEFTERDNREDGKQEVYPENIETWSDMGWTPIRRVIRHKTQKQLYRFLTHTGCVDVTEDHSLLNKRSEMIQPSSLNVGDELLHHCLPNETATMSMTEEEAWVIGFFSAEGTCGKYNCPSGQKYSWSIANLDLDLLNKCKTILEKIYSNHKFVIDDCIKSSACYKLSARGDVKMLVNHYRSICYSGVSDLQQCHNYKIVPTVIMNSPVNIKKAYLDGFYEGDGEVHDVNKRWDVKGKIFSAGLFYIAECCGYNCSVNTRETKPDCFRTTLTNKTQRKNPYAIKKIIPLGLTEDYVYDFETENHHFSAGIGHIVVHNTDSTMVDVGIKEPKDCDYWGNRIAKETSDLFPPPLKLEYEKAMRIFCIKKKKYAAFLVEDGEVDTNPENILTRGIVLSRRDNCSYLRNMYRTILHKILLKQTAVEVFDNLIDSIQTLMNQEVPHEELVIVRSVKDKYKQENYFMAVFASELKKIGKGPNPGDRLEYVFVVPRDNPQEELLGKRMRLASMYSSALQEGNAELIDVVYYLEHVLQNPIDQLFYIGFMKLLDELKDFGYKPGPRRRMITLTTPIKLIFERLKSGERFSLQDLKPWFRSILKTSQLKPQSILLEYTPVYQNNISLKSISSSSQIKNNDDINI